MFWQNLSSVFIGNFPKSYSRNIFYFHSSCFQPIMLFSWYDCSCFFVSFKDQKKPLNINNFKSSFSSSQWFSYSAIMFHFLFSDCPQLITSIYILFMQSQGSSLEDMRLHVGSTFLHARYAGLDMLSPPWHIRRGGDDCQERGSWKGDSLSPLGPRTAHEPQR